MKNSPTLERPVKILLVASDQVKAHARLKRLTSLGFRVDWVGMTATLKGLTVQVSVVRDLDDAHKLSGLQFASVVYDESVAFSQQAIQYLSTMERIAH